MNCIGGWASSKPFQSWLMKGCVPKLKLRSGSLTVHCNSCLMAKYHLNMPFGSLGIAYHLELKGGTTFQYVNEN